MIDLTKDTIRSYQRMVSEIYKTLEREPWCSLLHFEHNVRRISILNTKILSIRRAMKTSEIQKEE